MNRSTRKNLQAALFLLCSLSLAYCKVNTSPSNDNPRAISILMVGGGSSHDFDRWYKVADAETLRDAGLATVRYTSQTDSIAHYLSGVDVLYLVNNQPISDPTVRKAIVDFVAAGKGLVLGHAALWYNWNDWPEYNKQLVSGGSRNHDRYGTFEVKIAEPGHAITKAIPSSFTLKDELYHFIPDLSGPGITILATASVPGSDTSYPSVFVVRHNKGRIAGLALGHDGESHNLPAYKNLLRNAVIWAAGKM